MLAPAALWKTPSSWSAFAERPRPRRASTIPTSSAVYDWGQVGRETTSSWSTSRGRPLKELVRRRDRLPGGEAVAHRLELLAAVGAAHSNGSIHRDIKSQNILIDRAGRVKVADFGNRAGRRPGHDRGRLYLGTAQYLAPEQARGEAVDERSTCTPWGSSCTRCSPGGCRSRATAPSPWPSSTSTSCRPSRSAWCPASRTRSTNRTQGARQRPNRPLRQRRPSSPPTCAPPRPAALAGRPPLTPADERTQIVAPMAHPRRAGHPRHERCAGTGGRSRP